MAPMTNLEALDRHFRKRIRIVAENPQGKYSSTWMLWGNNDDFYFGSKTLLESFKVSLHKNGRGYVAYEKRYYKEDKIVGTSFPSRTLTEWALPKPEIAGAVQLAVIRLPADFCTGEATPDVRKKKALVLGVEKGCAAENGVFASVQEMQSLEEGFQRIGRPLFAVKLENGITVSIVVRSAAFDPSVLPTSEQLNTSKKVEITEYKSLEHRENLNMLIWNKPGDGEALQVIDVGGLKVIAR